MLDFKIQSLAVIPMVCCAVGLAVFSAIALAGDASTGETWVRVNLAGTSHSGYQDGPSAGSKVMGCGCEGDDQGNVYWMERGGYAVIRKYDAKLQRVVTFAGSSNGYLDGPLDVARWLRSHGIAGVVVKYRLPNPNVGLFVPNGSIPDMQRAIRIVRRNASQWNINPKRVGVMGFSAGGYMAAAAGTLFDQGEPDADDPIRRTSCRPDFIIPVYPLISLELQGTRSAGIAERMLGPNVNDKLIGEYSLDTRVTSQTPPAFLVHAHDDGLSVEHSIRFYLALRKAKVSAELLVYSKGGHGFGMRQRGLPVSAWRERWLEWMKAEGFLRQSNQP